MTFLAVDIGNTHSVLGWFSEGGLPREARLETSHLGTEDELALKLKGLSLLYNQKPPTAIAISSVVPSATRLFMKAVPRAFTNIHPVILDADSPYSFKIGVNPKEQVGIDRLVNAEAAFAKFGGGPCIILDSGTATTLCAIDSTGTYRGGAILPGIDMGMEALAGKAALLFKIDLSQAPKTAIGTNTEDALRSGILLGYACMLEGMVERFRIELEFANTPVIATGGISRRLHGLTSAFSEIDDALTLKGIKTLHDRMTRNV